MQHQFQSIATRHRHCPSSLFLESISSELQCHSTYALFLMHEPLIITRHDDDNETNKNSVIPQTKNNNDENSINHRFLLQQENFSSVSYSSRQSSPMMVQKPGTHTLNDSLSMEQHSLHYSTDTLEKDLQQENKHERGIGSIYDNVTPPQPTIYYDPFSCAQRHQGQSSDLSRHDTMEPPRASTIMTMNHPSVTNNNNERFLLFQKGPIRSCRRRGKR